MSCLKSFHLPFHVCSLDLQLLTQALRDPQSGCQVYWDKLEE